LDASRIDVRRLTLDRQRARLPELVTQVVDHCAEFLRGHDVRIRPPGPLPDVDADPVRFEQILTNLLSNAAKYGDPGGAIELALRPLDGVVEVSVTNQGPGLRADETERLFQRFYRAERARVAEREGLGLGLYIAKGLVEAHGGQIAVESKPEGPTRFSFTLPIYEAA
jgi:signal transduction histidine kinase